MNCSCLCLGPPSSGKTLLLKRMQTSKDTDLTITPTVETVGTNIVPIPRKPLDSSDKEKSKRSKGWDDKDVIGIREIGGSMAPLWPSYYASASLIIFVIDSSSLFQVSISTVMLMEMLSHEKLISTKFLIILAKKDLTSQKKLNHLKFMMRLDDIIRQTGNRTTVVEASSITGDGIEAVRNWVISNSSLRTHGDSRK